MRPMETLQDLIEEAKLRLVWWSLCIFSLTYFLSHTSSSMWMNLPISVLCIVTLRLLFYHVEFRWKVQLSTRPQSYLSHLEKKQLSNSDSRLVTPPLRWRRKIGSMVVEAAARDFIDKILDDFVLDLWYHEITPDKEAADLMRIVIMDALGEISGRVKEINLVDLLTRDIVDLIGDHLDLFRRNQAAIGTDVMLVLSTEERDEKLKHHLMNSKELHPALVSFANEHKILKRLMSGILAVVLMPRESQCPLVRTIARDIVASLVLQPVMDLASPVYINEVIEVILHAIMDDKPLEQSIGDAFGSSSSSSSKYRHGNDHEGKKSNQSVGNFVENDPLNKNSYNQQILPSHSADWAKMLEVATQKRTEVLAPDNLENMWAKGRNYKKKEMKNLMVASRKVSQSEEDRVEVPIVPDLSQNCVGNEHRDWSDGKPVNDSCIEKLHVQDVVHLYGNVSSQESQGKIIRSSSTSALQDQAEVRFPATKDIGRLMVSEFYSSDLRRSVQNDADKKISDSILRNEGSQAPKLKCQVVGAYFEKLASKSFAVYSIAVTGAENRSWFVKRRYRNFERLHRHLKDIPNYTLHLPPKRIFSSSTEDTFVHQRCIQLDKYLQDLLSIANLAEQHEVWDFLSSSSKNYSFGKSPSVMRTLAVNVDDAVDDIVRQFKGVSGGLMRTIVGSSSSPDGISYLMDEKNLSWHAEDVNKYTEKQNIVESVNSNSETEELNDQESHSLREANAHETGWHSDNELKGFPLRVTKLNQDAGVLNLDKKTDLDTKSDIVNRNLSPVSYSMVISNLSDDLMGMPPEWTPPNVCVPLLNLVDKVFQLNKRGWLRRQVFWLSKQILQVMMEDAIDDWLLRQICWLRKEETVAEGIRWVQNILWPGGKFFTRLQNRTHADECDLKPNPLQISQLGVSSVSKPVSFEEQLEAARRASNIKKLLFDGAPTALVSLIGPKQYRRCARDIFYFTQSTVCMKQLAYAILELLIMSVFPELRDLILELHGKSDDQST